MREDNFKIHQLRFSGLAKGIDLKLNLQAPRENVKVTKTLRMRKSFENFTIRPPVTYACRETRKTSTVSANNVSTQESCSRTLNSQHLVKVCSTRNVSEISFNGFDLKNSAKNLDFSSKAFPGSMYSKVNLETVGFLLPLPTLRRTTTCSNKSFMMTTVSMKITREFFTFGEAEISSY